MLISFVANVTYESFAEPTQVHLSVSFCLAHWRGVTGSHLWEGGSSESQPWEVGHSGSPDTTPCKLAIWNKHWRTHREKLDLGLGPRLQHCKYQYSCSRFLCYVKYYFFRVLHEGMLQCTRMSSAWLVIVCVHSTWKFLPPVYLAVSLNSLLKETK